MRDGRTHAGAEHDPAGAAIHDVEMCATAAVKECAGKIDSVVELLAIKLSDAVTE